MRTAESIAALKEVGLRNVDIARQLGISKQYVSHVCRMSQIEKTYDKETVRSEYVSVRVAGRLLGVTDATIRRWSDEGKIPSFRIEVGRRDRRFLITDLLQLRTTSETNNENAPN